MYMINGLTKFAEEDIYKDGCQPGGVSFDIDVVFKGETAEEVIEEFRNFVGAEKQGVALWADEMGRVDVQGMETEAGTSADKRDISAWKSGKMRLWLAVYTGYIVKTEVADLSKVTGYSRA